MKNKILRLVEKTQLFLIPTLVVLIFFGTIDLFFRINNKTELTKTTEITEDDVPLNDELSDEEPLFAYEDEDFNEDIESNFDIEQDVYNEVSDSLFDNIQSYYINESRDKYNKFVDQGKNISSDYYDFKYTDRADGYREFNNIRAIYKYMPDNIDMDIAIKANVDFIVTEDSYGNIQFLISDEGDHMFCYIYNKYEDKTKATKKLIKEAIDSNKKVEIKGVFQRQSGELDKFNIFVHNVEIVN